MKEENEALKTLQRDNSVTILPADKGRATVILNTEDYKQRDNQLLSDTNTYQPIPKDPPTDYKKELKGKLQRLLKEKKRNKNLYYILQAYTNGRDCS